MPSTRTPVSRSRTPRSRPRDYVVVTVAGADKRDALARVRAGDTTAPAARVDAAEVVWLVDAAAGRLPAVTTVCHPLPVGRFGPGRPARLLGVSPDPR